MLILSYIHIDLEVLNMDFKQLESFVTIAKLKSFSKAAEHLYLTQPTISNHIQILEKELNTVLINRTNKNISLTKAGKLLYKHAIEILNQRESAVFQLNQFKGRIEGILDISASTIPEQYYLPELLLKFNSIYPDVKYNLEKYDTTQVIEKILAGEIDFGIVGAKKDFNQLEYIDIMDDNIILVAPKSKSSHHMDIISLKDLCKLNIIMREEGSGTRKIVEDLLAENDMYLDDFNIIAYVENTETIKELVKKGMGLTFISEKAVFHDIQKGLLKKVIIPNFEIRRKFYFVYHKSRALSPLAEAFKSFVLQDNDIS